jgi:hypothetical protein
MRPCTGCTPGRGCGAGAGLPQVPLGCLLALLGLAAPGVLRPGVILPVLGALLLGPELRPLMSPGL